MVDQILSSNKTQNMSNTKECQLLELLATNSFINGLTTFKGERDEDIIEYFRQFEDQTFGLEDRIKVLGIRRSFLGAAREWLTEKCQEQLANGDYKVLKSKILARYQLESSNLTNRLKLNAMRFDTLGKETLASFIDRFIARSKRLDIRKDSEIITGVLLALPVEVQGELEYLEPLAKVKTLGNLTKLAQRYDSITSKRCRASDDSEKIAILVDSIEKMKNEFRQTIATISSREYQRDKSKFKSEDRKCYSCQQVGHLIKDCPKVKSTRLKKDQYPQLESHEAKKDYTKINQEAIEEYEKKFGKPEMDCPICKGYHFVYHCPMKSLKD